MLDSQTNFMLKKKDPRFLKIHFTVTIIFGALYEILRIWTRLLGRTVLKLLYVQEVLYLFVQRPPWFLYYIPWRPLYEN